jgi:membrane protein
MAIPSYNAEPAESSERRVWRIVAHAPVDSLWCLEGTSKMELAHRTLTALRADRVFGRAAELGFYFFFSLFPALFCAAAILGLVARSAHQIYARLLGYLALVVPTSALGTVLHTFNQTTAAASSGKITLSLLGAIWSASVGISAIQDSLNDVYKIEDTRSYVGARIKAIGLTFLVTAMVTVSLSSMFGADFVAQYVERQVSGKTAMLIAGIGIRGAAWTIATLFLILVFAVIYYWAPDWRRRRWRWLTPGSVIGIGSWLIASIALRIYLSFFNNYSVTYGSLGAVISLLTWFYITGLMLLVGGEINSQIEAAAVRARLAEHRSKTRRPERAA